LPSSGPNVFQCWSLTDKAGAVTFRQFAEQGWTDAQLVEHGYAVGCRKHYRKDALHCPWCGRGSEPNQVVEWCPEAAEDALTTIATRSLDTVEHYFGNAVEIISSCLRALFISAPGKDLIASDYSAIEAVVLAELSGETWRQEVFRTHGLIYEKTLSDITGIPFEEILAFKKRTGQHHPQRKPLGKIPELASGYAGWVGAWVQFGADEFFTEPEIKDKILIWRNKSPNIVEFWGGQYRGLPWDANRREELFGLEGAAIAAVLNPGHAFSPAPSATGHGHKIVYQMFGDALYCQLPSGRLLTYHRPRLHHSDRMGGGWALTYEGFNTNPKNGPRGWIRMSTYSGKLTENVVQATSFDILAHAIVALEAAGYPVVLHVHDEIVVEVPEGWGSSEDVERIMMTLPAWAEGWAIKAAGGWRGKRYRK
jgi:DNA polymerase